MKAARPALCEDPKDDAGYVAEGESESRMGLQRRTQQAAERV